MTGGVDARQVTRTILEADRRRVRRLLIATILTWVLAAGMILWMLVAFGLLFPKEAQLARDIEQRRFEPGKLERMRARNQILFQMITLGVAVSVGVLGLAALLTILLVVASRRATLRQINANLVEIAEQLKQLRKQPGTG